MAYTGLSLIQNAYKGTKGVDANGYALSSDESIVKGTKVAIASQAGAAIAGTSSSTGTAVTGTTTSFDTELKVGDLIYDAANPSEVREVVSITDATNLVIDSAFTTDLSGSTVEKKNTVYHTSLVERLDSFRSIVYFEKSLRKDVPVSTEAEIISLEN